MKHHYVYKSFEEEGREYIGCRSCNCLPEEDTKYFGSFSDKSFKPTGKTILFVCETRKEAAEIEIELHDFFDVAVNPQFANRSKQTSTGFDRAGVPRTEAQKKAHSERMSGEKHPMFGMTGEKSPCYGRTGERHPNYGRTGALHPRSKAIIAIEPDGTQRHFGSGHEAARDLEINRVTLRKYAKNGHVQTKGKWEGWQFLCENR
jgi:hypothetical protein